MQASFSTPSSVLEEIKKIPNMSEALDECIKFRRWLHQNAEGRCEEYNTAKRIKQLLITLAKVENLRKCAGTGIIADIHGTGPAGPKRGIALRADIDGLKMKEDNPDLEYASKTEFAHMCGHDGHAAILLMTACLL